MLKFTIPGDNPIDVGLGEDGGFELCQEAKAHSVPSELALGYLKLLEIHASSDGATYVTEGRLRSGGQAWSFGTREAYQLRESGGGMVMAKTQKLISFTPKQVCCLLHCVENFVGECLFC